MKEFRKTIYEGHFSIITLGSMKAMKLDKCSCGFPGSIKDTENFK